MTAISTAVSLTQVSAIVGYEVEAVLAEIAAGNLPIRIAVLAEANTANQSGLPTKLEFTTKSEAGTAFGYGSPAYMAARILRPYSGDKLGAIPTLIYPVTEAAGATATAITYSISGTATATTTHYLKVNGRTSLDGAVYQYVVEVGDTATEVSQKMIDAINNVLGAPATGTVVTDTAVFTSKWKGVSSADMNIEIDVDGVSAGLTYVLDSITAGAGLPSISDALSNFGDEWNVLVINCVGTDSITLDALEAFNGTPAGKTGRYVSTTFKPFTAFSGTTESTLATLTLITDSRKDELTNCIVPLPNSSAFPFEGAAETVFKYATIAQNTPHIDPIGIILIDTPGAEDAGDFADDSKRNSIVKIGCSTVKLNSGNYEIVDLATTSHPDDEPQTAVLYRWVRNWICNMNVRYKYFIFEEISVTGKTLLPNTSQSTAVGTISPNRWKGRLFALADQLEDEALIADAQYMKDSIQVAIGESNADRFETLFGTQLTGTARVQSTTNQFTFNFGG